VIERLYLGVYFREIIIVLKSLIKSSVKLKIVDDFAVKFFIDFLV